jgi:hypothetical protein
MDVKAAINSDRKLSMGPTTKYSAWVKEVRIVSRMVTKINQNQSKINWHHKICCDFNTTISFKSVQQLEWCYFLTADECDLTNKYYSKTPEKIG